MRRGSWNTRWAVELLAVGVACWLVGGAIAGAAQAAGGVIAGLLTDEQGGALPGVTLTLRNVETGLVRTTVSEADGRYRLAGLPPGRYELRAELQGFTAVELKDLVLTVGLELRRDIQMTIQTLQETLTVTAEAPMVEPTRHGIAGVVTQQQIETLPIEGRVAVSLALLMPGTGADTTRPRRNNANIGAGGITHFSTNFLVDGTMNMSTKAGEPRMDFPQAAIREFQVHLSQAPAEYGGRTGGVVSVVTRSGTNRYAGEAFEFFRDKALNGMNRFEKQEHEEKGTPKPEYRRHQFGAALGGPLIRDRLHFFAASERTDENEAFIVKTGQPQFYSALEGTFPYENLSTLFFLRGDAQLTPQQNLFVRWAFQGGTTICENCGGTNAAASGADLYIPRDSLVVGHTWVIGTRALNEVRFQRAIQWHYERPHGSPKWTKVADFSSERFRGVTPIFLFPSLTWGNDNIFVHTQEIWEYRDDFSVTADWRGHHTIKMGGAFLNLPMREDAQGNVLGTWTFATDQPFDGTAASIARLQNPIQFTAAFPPLYREQFNHYYQVYVQDEWRPHRDLTVSAGLRYEVQTRVWNEDREMSFYPRPLPLVSFAARGDKDNVAPRVGFAWDVGHRGRSVVRGGYGRVHHMVMNGWHGAETTTLRQTSINIRNPAYPDPYQGRDPLAFASTAPPNISIVDDRLVNPVATTANLGFSQELRANLALHVDGVYTKTDDFPVTVNINTPDPVTRRRPRPEWGRILQLQPIGQAKYRGLFVRLERRYANRHQYMLSYTLSKHDNNWQGATSTGNITDFYNPRLDWGPANNDRRHALVASGAVLLPYDITFGVVWTVRSSMPFSARAGRDLNADGANTDYVPGTTKNMGNRENARMLELVNAWREANGRRPISAAQIDSNRFNRLDVKAVKAFELASGRRLELIGQVFNLLGTENLLALGSGWVVNALSDSFGKILTAQPGRQAELAVRVVW